jgi:flagellar basal body-associated protein FliL
MGQQQLLLIILGVIIVGIAIAVGISMFSSGSVQANRDGIVNDLNNLAANAYQFKIRPTTMGGGGGKYTGNGTTYVVPTKLASNENGSYAVSVAAQSVTFTGTSSASYGTVVAVCDSTGALGSFTYTGQFQ